MTALRGILITGGISAVLLAVACSLLLLARAQRDTARAERQVARAELATWRVTVDAQAISVREARAAAERLAAENADNDQRCIAAIAELRAAADRQRIALRKCNSAAAVAERMGDLFP